MYVINSDTNAMIGAFPVPTGSFEWPYFGTVTISTSQVTTNISVGMGDTVVIWPGGAGVVEGVSPMLFFIGGVGLVVTCFGVLAFARKMARWLWGGSQIRDI